jgi:hypothetical protein
MFIAALCGAAAWTAGSAGIMVIEQFIRYVELAVGLMLNTYSGIGRAGGLRIP